MATGDANDMLTRIKSVLPSQWFGDTTPILNALLQALAVALAFVYSLYLYAVMQSRIATASDIWLDLISYDFYGDNLPRRVSETDDSFRTRIQSGLFKEKATRYAIAKALTDLTGTPPKMFEPTLPADTGAYGAPNCGYSVAGGYGSLLLPAQGFITAYYTPQATGVPSVAGYGISVGGYGVGTIEYLAAADLAEIGPADIYQTVADTKAEGVEVWVTVSSQPAQAYYLDLNFILDEATLS